MERSVRVTQFILYYVKSRPILSWLLLFNLQINCVMKKKFYVMYEMLNCINFSSRSFDSFEDARKVLEKLRDENDPMLQRLVVGYWEEIPFKGSGNLKLFHICAESHRISK